jgi:hypothetical protein
MLIEIWERLRGYDKWIQAQAILKVSEVEEVVVGHTRPEDLPIYEWRGNEEIFWTDQAGVAQCEPLAVSENSPIFKMYDGNPIIIRYNPASPSEFYVREQLRYQVNLRARFALAVLLALCVILVIVRN